MPSGTKLQLTDPPASKEHFEGYLNLLRGKTLKNSSFSVIQFPGSGIYSHFKYVFKYLDLLGFNSAEEKKQLFTYINMRTLVEHPEAFYIDTLTYLYQVFLPRMEAKVAQELSNLLKTGVVTKVQFNQAIYNITFSNERASDSYRIAFVVEEFGYLTKEVHADKCLEFLSSLKRINPMNISYIFMVAEEIDEDDEFSDMAKEIFDNFVWYRQYMFDDKCADLMFKNNEKWNLLEMDTSFKNEVKRVGKGDPFLIHRFVKKYIENPQNAKRLDFSSYKQITTFLGEKWLESRYLSILYSLKAPSLLFLVGEKSTPSEYLVNCGLYSTKEKDYINWIMANFVKENVGLIKDVISVKQREEVTSIVVDEGSSANAQGAFAPFSQKNFYKSLTGKELIVFELLEKNVGQTVSKEKIAEVMWGSDWEQNYSDWGIDKIISNIRKKIRESDSGAELKALKGEGFMLVTL